MKRKHLLLAGALVLLAAGLVACVLPGTATLRLRNESGKTITAAWFTLKPSGTPVNRLNLGETVADGDSRDFFSIRPGTYDITFTLSGYGDWLAYPDLTFEDNNWMQKTLGTPP
jgi:hypothetical protein